MSKSNDIFLRKIAKDSKSMYDIDLESYVPISDKVYKCKCSNGQEYYIKKTELYAKEKYHFLYHQGVENVLYPLQNKRNEFITEQDNEEYYVMPLVPDVYMLNEIKAEKMINELSSLHSKTAFKRNLSVSKSRRKMEEILEYLNYKFVAVESFIRTIEAQQFDEFSITILKNYQFILDCKKELAKVNKKVIQAIKESKSVYYCFLHNNPKLDHVLVNSGRQYFISIEKGKIGIPSLDIAKFYVENEDLNIDLGRMIEDYFSKYDDEFYFDYFEFLVLFIYIKGLTIIEKDYISSQSFISTAQSLQKFFKTFSIEIRK